MTQRYTPTTNVPVSAMLERRPLSPIRTMGSPAVRRNETFDIAAYVGQSLDEVDANFDMAAFEAANATSPTRDALNNQADLETLEATAEKETDAKSYSGFLLEGAMTAGDARYSPALARAMSNQRIAMTMLEERFETELGKSFGGKVVDFVDRYMVRYVPIGMIEDLVRKNEGEGWKIVENAANMPPEQFATWFEGYMEDLAAEGVFTDENFFAIQEGMFRAINSGYDPDAGFNQALAGVDALTMGISGAALARRGATALTRTSAIRGADAGADVHVNADAAGLMDNPQVHTESMPQSFDPSTPSETPKPSRSGVSVYNDKNQIINEIDLLSKQGVFGPPAPEAEITKLAAKARKEIDEISSRPVIREEVIDLGLNRRGFAMTFGKAKDGVPFKDIGNATKLKNQMTENGLAAVVDEVPEGFVVKVVEELDVTGAVPAISLGAYDELAGWQTTFARYLGSSRTLDDVSLATLANQGEGGVGAIADAVNPHIKRVNKAPHDSKVAIGKVFQELRDGPDSHLRQFYSRSDFETKFQEAHPTHKKATDQDWETYQDIVTINDASYILQGSRIAQRYADNGFKTIKLKDGDAYPARPVDTVPEGELIYDSQGLTVDTEALPNTQVYELDRHIHFEDGTAAKYVTGVDDIRMILPEDVLPYNAGGRRMNPNTNYFVTYGNQRGVAMLGTFSQKQAKIASQELANIAAAWRKIGKSMDELTDELDEVIANNNKWNPGIENTSDFAKLARKKNWDLSQNISYKRRDGIVEAQGDLWDEATYGDMVQSTKRRSNDVLMNFGGGEVYNYNPVRAIEKQFTSAAQQYAMSNYTRRAERAWVEKATRPTGGIPANRSISRIFEEFDLTGHVLEKELKDLRDIIRRRKMTQTRGSKELDNMGQRVAEWIFDRTGITTNIGDPTHDLLNLGFQSAFGFMNVSQFFLQASHMGAIATMSNQGIRGAATAFPLRAVMHVDSPLAIKRFATATGMSLEDAEELVQFARSSGRLNIESDAIEKGTGVGSGLSAWGGNSYLPRTANKALLQGKSKAAAAWSLGTKPFEEGERTARLTGITTAFFEYKKRFKGASALTEKGREWITRREQDLSMNMTTQGRAAFQDGVMRLPTQWLSHSMRIMETLFVGRGFTKLERARLGVWLAMSGGMAGMGLGSAVDTLADRFGVDPTGNTYVAMKYGVVDAFLSWGLQGLTGQDIRTAFGMRMAPIHQFIDIYRQVTEEAAWETLGGPSVSILSGVLGPVLQSIGHVLDGHPQSAFADVEKAFRQASGLDNAVKGLMIMNHGTYTSRSGVQQPQSFSKVEGLLRAAGINNFKETEFYQRQSGAFRDSKDRKAFTRDMQKMYQRGIDKVTEGDHKAGRELIDEVWQQIAISGFSPYDITQIRNQITKGYEPELWRMIIELLKRENKVGAEVVESLK